MPLEAFYVVFFVFSFELFVVENIKMSRAFWGRV